MPTTFKFYFSALVLCLVSALSSAQNGKILQGQLLDSANREAVIGGVIYSLSEKKGVFTDAQGRFSIESKLDTGSIRISFTGYRPQFFRIERWPSKGLEIRLKETEQKEVIITSEKSVKEKVQANQMSVENLSVREAKLLPAIFGEVDIIKTLQLKPGVQSGGEGFSGLYVRGGGPDQNLMLIDGATVYNPNHLFGFFSVFNSDAVHDVELYKGGFPSKFSGRLSSVVDINMRDGDKQKKSVTGGIGLISSRLGFDGPIIKDKLTVLVGGRRTYFDIFTRYYNRTQDSKPEFTPIPDYYFQDLNTKITWTPNPNDKITFTGYWGRDVFTYNRNRFAIKFDWGNTVGNLRWLHKFNEKWNISSNVIITDYNYKIRNSFDSFKFGISSGVRDYTAKTEVNFTPSPRNSWQMGGGITRHSFEIGRASASSSDGTFNFEAGQGISANNLSVFGGNVFNFTEKWQINTGFVYTAFNNNRKWFNTVEPRFSTRYSLTDKISLKANYTRMYQFLHLVSNSGASLPTDLWYPSNATVKPQISDQVAASYSISLFNDNLFFSNEYYYKNMQRQIDLKDGASFFINDKLDTIFVFGHGWAYGTEFYLEKKKGRLTGWIGYTLSYTWRQFDAVNFGKKFHPRYDRRHDISVVMIYKLNKRMNLSTTWVYGSGNAISLPEGRFFHEDIIGTTDPVAFFNVIPLVRNRNSFRMAPYHRWDIGLVYKLKPRHGESDLTFSIYNAYNRLNPFFIYFETVTTNPDGTGAIVGFRAKQVSLFPVIPSITYNFRF